jgi:hypothetical protein
MFSDFSNDGPSAVERGKDYRARGYFGPCGWWESDKPSELRAHYYTQLEAVAAIVPGLRVGFNPAELLDFLLGWTSLDLFKDDVGSRPAKP